jgi:N-carbamoylputrescine amidase
MQGAAFSNLVYIAVVNRTGKEETLDFAGRSLVVGPDGDVVSRARTAAEDLLVVDIDLERIERSRKERPFLRDRRPEIYGMLSSDYPSP